MTENLAIIAMVAAANNHLAIVSVARSDGSVHSSLVNAGVMTHPVSGDTTAAFVVRGDARKLALMRASGHATVAFHHAWQWAAVDGRVQVIGPDDDANLPALLRAVFTAAGGTHDNWDEFDRVMAAERRVAVFVTPQRILTNDGG